MNLSTVSANVRSGEGRSSTVYKDSRGYWTIGEGICVDAAVPGCGLRPEEIDFIKNNRIREATEALDHTVPFWRRLHEECQNALAELCFMLGASGVVSFKKMLAALSEDNYERAADEFRDSLLSHQIGAERFNRLEHMIRSA